MSVTVVHYLRAVLVCGIAGLFCSYQFMLQGATSVMVPQLMSGLNLNLADIGLLTSSFLYLYLLFQLPGGYLADHFRARYLLVFCSLLMALACYWFSIAGSMVEACMARGLMGIATSPAIVIALNLVNRWFPERWFCGLAGLVEAFALAGGATGPLVIPGLMGTLDWREAMAMIALPGGILALCSLLWVRDYPDSRNTSKSESSPEKQLSDNGQAFDRRLYGLYCLFGFGLFGMISCFAGLWGIPFFNVRYPEHTETVALAVSLIFIGAAVGAPLLGFLTSRFKSQIIMLLSLLGGMVTEALLVFCLCPLSLIALLCFITGFACGGYMLIFGEVKKIAPAHSRGLLLAGANGSMLLAGPVMQPLMGWIVDYRITTAGGQATLADYQAGLLPLFVTQLFSLLAIVIIVRR